MLLPLQDLDLTGLRSMLQVQFGASDAPFEFFPVGSDSWQYRVDDLWVSIRQDLRGHRPESYEAARILEDSGLKFVLAPLAGEDGKVTRLFNGRPVVVSRFRDISPIKSPSASEILETQCMLHALHGIDERLSLSCEDFTMPFKADIYQALEFDLDETEDLGPYARKAHAMICLNRPMIEKHLKEIENITQICVNMNIDFVLTHGEPGDGNVVQSEGRLMLGDWGELMWGPEERDWFHLHRSFGSAPSCRPVLHRFYELRWFFNELTEYTSHFFKSHSGGRDESIMWENFTACFDSVGK